MDAQKLTFALAWCAAALFIRPTSAQTPLTAGETITGRVAPNETLVYTFSAREGNVLSFIAQSDDGQLDPAIAILNASGAVVASNDDYDYPNRTDALIEAFTVPRTGEYQLELRAVNPEGGAFRLAMSIGYSSIILSDRFEVDTDAVPLDVSSPLALFQRSGELVMGVQGIDQLGVAAHPRSRSSTFYASVDVTSVSHRGGWIVGLAVRIQPDGSRYQVEFDERGLWRTLLFQGTERTIIRDWNTHPAIRAGSTRFNIGVLAAVGGFDVFYDGLFVGTVPTRALEGDGLLGFVVQSRSALDAAAQATFDNLLITVPVQVAKARVRPSTIQPGSATFVARQLHRSGLIPLGGEQVLDIAETTNTFSGAGVSEAPLARGLSVENFVYSAVVSITTARQGVGGCGLIARRDGLNYLLAYTDTDGGYGLSRRAGDAFHDTSYARMPTRAPQVWLMMIASGERVDLFVDGRYFASLNHPPMSGPIGTAGVNFDPQDTTCRLRSVWVWRW
ncbi:PPC domain-containing protein [Aggregatilineales bacterium SYSU G02658]